MSIAALSRSAFRLSFERREVEARGARIALAAAAAAQLVVDAARFVALRAEHVQAAGGLHDLVLGGILRVASEQDVRAASGHVRRDRDRALAAGLRDDLR